MESPEGNNSYELKKLTNESTVELKKKWTLFLVLCCITASWGSFQFGFNISSLNSPTQVLKEFIFNEFNLFKRYHVGKAMFEQGEGWLNGNKTLVESRKLTYESRKADYIGCWGDEECQNKILEEGKKTLAAANEKLKSNFSNMDQVFDYLEKTLADKTIFLEEKRVELQQGKEKVERVNEYVWTLINSLFVVGGMIGALTSKYVLDYIGRKKGILLNFSITILGSVVVFIAPYLKSPVCLIISRFLFGIQGGMACSLIPTYLSEISPGPLRGQTGVIPQLFITIGILFGQILGFKQIFGNENLWHFLLAFPFVPAFVGGIIFLVFFPESPKALLQSKNNFVDAAKLSLQLLRHEEYVDDEIRVILEEVNSGSCGESVSILGLFKSSELRWPLITSLILQMTQQLCGINAIFFYSSSIFKGAKIPDDFIQYAIASTGIVNILATIVCVPLIDKLGRKPLLVFSMSAMIVDFVLLTVFLNLDGDVFAYLSIGCIGIFVVSFAIALGPIPFIYAAECFRQNARSSAMAVSVLTNWISALLLTVAFPPLQGLLKAYVFIIFLVIVLLALIVIVLKVPETKGKTADQIIMKFNKTKKYNHVDDNLPVYHFSQKC